jgi:hypothetical protein
MQVRIRHLRIRWHGHLSPHTRPAVPYLLRELGLDILPRYLAATSLKAGPTTLWSTAWQAVQPYRAGISSGVSVVALACSVREADAFSSA